MSTGSTNFYSTFEAELEDTIPVIQTSIGGTRIIGRLTAGKLVDSYSEYVPSHFQCLPRVQAIATACLFPPLPPTKSYSIYATPSLTQWQSSELKNVYQLSAMW